MFAINKSHRRLSYIAYWFFAGLLMLSLIGCEPKNNNNPNDNNSNSNLVEQCSGKNPPTGFIKVDDKWDPTKCGEPTKITYNVSTYERYDNKSAGNAMTVCASESTPVGWTDSTRSHDGNKCGHPTTSSTENLKLIIKN